jgi:hypothetical protein
MTNRNWPALIAVALGVIFIVGVWVNNYRVTHATAATLTSTK